MIKVAYHSCYTHPLPDNHRFPMLKYKLLYEQLLYEGIMTNDNFFTPDFPITADLTLAHNQDYIEKLKGLKLSSLEIRKTGFPLSKELIERELIIMEGTWRCALWALENEVALNIAGGTHHAFRDRGEGFCLLNDIAIAATNLIVSHPVKKILIIDLDVHQGDGTAKIFENNPNVFTFSIHGANNYPARKEKSDLDIPLPDGTEDRDYLSILNNTLPTLIRNFKPDFVFYQSGVDVLETDKLGKLALTIQGCRERDYIVFDNCKKNKLPIVASMGGGYSERIAHIVDAHTNTFRVAQNVFS